MTPGSAGLDIHTPIDVILSPGIIHKLDTGLKMIIPEGYYGQIQSRPSLCLKGIFVLGGVIDADYRGEISVILVNLSKTAHRISMHDRIAQVVCIKITYPISIQVKRLTDSKRSDGGFGSTGI